jgi:septal ring factor EnvC (AmiA/AmiB activator)
MSTEDIRIKLQADESGAVNAFRKLRSEVLNNEQGLKQLGQQGKMTGKGLKDMASFLGPEFQILGDRLDHVSGAMADIKGAGLLAKGAMIGLVATAGFQVGQMIGDWVFETEKWKKALEDARGEADRLNSKLLEGARERATELTTDQLQTELAGVDNQLGQLGGSIGTLRDELNQMNILSRTFTAGVAERTESIAILEQEREAARKTREMYQGLLREREKQAEKAREAEEAKALAEEARAAEKAAAAAQQLIDTQEDYLFQLDAELVKIRDGEEAYMRLTLAKRGFTEESINSALALKAEISELSEAAKARERSGTGAGGISVSAPGQVQGTQARFITRGIGMSGQDKILEATKKQIEKQEALLTEQKKQTQILQDRLPRVTY